MHHQPQFDFVQHAFGLLVGHTYQGLLVNCNELISRPQTSILHKKETEPLVIVSRRTTQVPYFSLNGSFCVTEFLNLLDVYPLGWVCMRGPVLRILTK